MAAPVTGEEESGRQALASREESQYWKMDRFLLRKVAICSYVDFL